MYMQAVTRNDYTEWTPEM